MVISAIKNMANSYFKKRGVYTDYLRISMINSIFDHDYISGLLFE
jgi:hypothetical protein